MIIKIEEKLLKVFLVLNSQYKTEHDPKQVSMYAKWCNEDIKKGKYSLDRFIKSFYASGKTCSFFPKFTNIIKTMREDAATSRYQNDPKVFGLQEPKTTGREQALLYIKQMKEIAKGQ